MISRSNRKTIIMMLASTPRNIAGLATPIVASLIKHNKLVRISFISF
jgi:hypothetical protein